MDDLQNYKPKHKRSARRIRLSDAVELDKNGYIHDPKTFRAVLNRFNTESDISWEAAYRIGVLCLDGLYFEREPEEAFSYFQKAMELCPEIEGYQADIHTALGYCYLKGIGTEKNREKAIGHHRSAILMNEDAFATILLSDLYRNSPKDEHESLLATRLYHRMMRRWHRFGWTPADWRIMVYLNIRLVRNELYCEPLYHFGYRDNIEDSDIREEEANRFAGIIMDLIDLSEEIREIADVSDCKEIKEEYAELRKDLKNAVKTYLELDPEMEILKEEGTFYSEYVTVFLNRERLDEENKCRFQNDHQNDEKVFDGSEEDRKE